MKHTTLAFVATLSLLAAAPAAYAAQKFTYASYFGDNYTVSKADIWMMDEIEKRTNGEIKFERYHNSTLLKAPDIYPGLSNGAVDVASGTPAAYNRTQYRLSNVLLPYTSSNAQAIGEALTELYQTNEDFRKEYEDRGAKVLYFIPWGESSFYSSKAPLATAEDFKGKKVRSMQSIAEAVQALGATPVAMAWNEAVEGLSRGVVDIVGSVPFDSGVLSGMHESAKYGSDGGDMGVFTFAVISVSKNRYDKLTPEQQKIFDEVGVQAAAKYYELLDASYDEVTDRLCNYKDKITINIFSPDEAKKVSSDATVALQDNWIKWAAKGTEVDTQAFYTEFVDLVRKHEKNHDWKSGYQRLKDRGCAA